MKQALTALLIVGAYYETRSLCLVALVLLLFAGLGSLSKATEAALNLAVETATLLATLNPKARQPQTPKDSQP